MIGRGAVGKDRHGLRAILPGNLCHLFRGEVQRLVPGCFFEFALTTGAGVDQGRLEPVRIVEQPGPAVAPAAEFAAGAGMGRVAFQFDNPAVDHLGHCPALPEANLAVGRYQRGSEHALFFGPEEKPVGEHCGGGDSCR